MHKNIIKQGPEKSVVHSSSFFTWRGIHVPTRAKAVPSSEPQPFGHSCRSIWNIIYLVYFYLMIQSSLWLQWHDCSTKQHNIQSCIKSKLNQNMLKGWTWTCQPYYQSVAHWEQKMRPTRTEVDKQTSGAVVCKPPGKKCVNSVGLISTSISWLLNHTKSSCLNDRFCNNPRYTMACNIV